ncbi:unnamed protein product [Closterium sp. Yama58-4]|nr:unnamed protein product [Closterium sp. Yama58-4]
MRGSQWDSPLEVCASDPAYNCHNNLRSSLSLDVHLVRDGYVKFNFTVSAEMGHDGLAFYIDSLSQPLMALTSYQFEPREMAFPVEAGQHRLVWVYSKDDKWSKGEDIATIPTLALAHTIARVRVTPSVADCQCHFNAACLLESISPHAPPAMFSPPAYCPAATPTSPPPCLPPSLPPILPSTLRPFLLSSSPFRLLPSSPDSLIPFPPLPASFHIPPRVPVHVSSAEGAGACEPCSENTISSMQCERFHHHIHAMPARLQEANHEPCPDGQQAEPDPQSGEIRCTLCPPGTARQASYEGGAGSAGSILEGRCEACSAGQVAMKILSLKHFTMQPNGALPPNFTTGCHGDCGTFGWRAFQDHLDSGSGHGPTATIWLALDVQMAVRGYMSFNYSVDILPGDPGRAFFFFIDHDLMDYVEVTSWAMWSCIAVMPCIFCAMQGAAVSLHPHSLVQPTAPHVPPHSYSPPPPTAPSVRQQQRVEWEDGGEKKEHPGAGEDETHMSGMWELTAGRHSLMWVWQKLDDTGAATRTTRDSAVIYDIHIEGVADGGAARCEEVPPGSTLAGGGDSYVPCPPGTFSEGGASSCLPCPPNTFNNKPQGRQWECMPCGAGTSSLAGSTECFIGDAARPASFCTFNLPTDQLPRSPHLGEKAADEQAGQEGGGGAEGEEGKGKRGMEGEAGEGGALPAGGTAVAVRGNETAAAVVFDLSPLSRMHPGRMFGPLLDAAAAAEPDGDAAGGGQLAEGGAAGGGGQEGKGSRAGGQAVEYLLSVCDRDSSNDTCYDYSGRSLNTYACKVDPREATSGARPGHNLGSAVAVYPLAAVHAGLYRRGLVMAFTGDECPQTNLPRETNLTFICDPAAGHGQPEAWTEEGQMAALNPVLGYPQYAQRGGAVQRIEQSDCSFSLVWYSLFACPLCSHEDYERVETAECMDEKRATYKWKFPRVCQLNPSNPLPPDEPCEPCKPGDIIRTQGDCADANGNHNVTYSWRQPHHCSPTLPGAASLPAPELVGACEQRWVYVPSEALSPMWIALFVGLGVLIVSFGYLSLVTWLRSRRLRQMYQRLVEAEVHMEGEMGDLRADGDGDGDEDAEDNRLTSMGVGDALVIQTALSVTLASAARRAGWISYHPERIGNENVRKAVDVAMWVGDGITALGCAVMDAVKKMAGRGGNRLGRR